MASKTTLPGASSRVGLRLTESCKSEGKLFKERISLKLVKPILSIPFPKWKDATLINSIYAKPERRMMLKNLCNKNLSLIRKIQLMLINLVFRVNSM